MITAQNFNDCPRGHTSRWIRSAGHTLRQTLRPQLRVAVAWCVDAGDAVEVEFDDAFQDSP